MPDIVTAQVKDTSANPAPLGLFAFGMTTVLLNMHNAGFYTLNSMILGMGLCYGGAAQVIAGILESRKNNTFGMTAFISYGFFWLSLVVLVFLPKVNANATGFATDPKAFGAYLAVWGIFTAGLFIGTLRLSVALMFIFGSLTILFFMLAIGKIADPGEGFEHITGFEGIICGASAMYAGLAQVLNEVYGKTVLPLGIVKR